MKKIIEYIQSDYYRYSGKKKSFWYLTLKALCCRNYCFAYSYWMRLGSGKSILSKIARIVHDRLSRKYGLQISPFCKIGYGLYIGHGVGVVINSGTIIGNNCNISQFLSIGTNHKTPAIIGDNVYIGPNVCIVEDVYIGNNTTIGAGSVVVKNVPDNTTVAGCPAKILGENKHPEYVHNRWPLNG